MTSTKFQYDRFVFFLFFIRRQALNETSKITICGLSWEKNAIIIIMYLWEFSRSAKKMNFICKPAIIHFDTINRTVKSFFFYLLNFFGCYLFFFASWRGRIRLSSKFKVEKSVFWENEKEKWWVKIKLTSKLKLEFLWQFLAIVNARVRKWHGGRHV